MVKPRVRLRRLAHPGHRARHHHRQGGIGACRWGALGPGRGAVVRVRAAGLCHRLLQPTPTSQRSETTSKKDEYELRRPLRAKVEVAQSDRSTRAGKTWADLRSILDGSRPRSPRHRRVAVMCLGRSSTYTGLAEAHSSPPSVVVCNTSPDQIANTSTLIQNLIQNDFLLSCFQWPDTPFAVSAAT
jgi:hypothetical protein